MNEEKIEKIQKEVSNPLLELNKTNIEAYVALLQENFPLNPDFASSYQAIKDTKEKNIDIRKTADLPLFDSLQEQITNFMVAINLTDVDPGITNYTHALGELMLIINCIPEKLNGANEIKEKLAKFAYDKDTSEYNTFRQDLIRIVSGYQSLVEPSPIKFYQNQVHGMISKVTWLVALNEINKYYIANNIVAEKEILNQAVMTPLSQKTFSAPSVQSKI